LPSPILQIDSVSVGVIGFRLLGNEAMAARAVGARDGGHPKPGRPSVNDDLKRLRRSADLNLAVVLDLGGYHTFPKLFTCWLTVERNSWRVEKGDRDKSERDQDLCKGMGEALDKRGSSRKRQR
jgi:hypothetical protein